MTPPEQQSPNPFASLRRFARAPRAVELCELCSSGLADDHQHLVEPATRKLLCACDACAILFSDQSGRKYRRVPRDPQILEGFVLSDAQWDALMIPINMAFFFYSSPLEKLVAIYPSPAGPTESLLGLDSWNDIVRDNKVLERLQPDVEALLVHRIARRDGSAVPQYFLAPIDECYKLVGLIRAYWRGFSGGTRVWEEINAFFTRLRERSGNYREASRA